MRKPIIAGNWKMNKTPAETRELITQIQQPGISGGVDVVLCVPYTSFHAAASALEGDGISLGAQNVHWADFGAFTGEISADMLAECGVKYVIIGHSERRQYFGESDATVNRRAHAALGASLVPIICVGETLEQREAGYTYILIAYQTLMALRGMNQAEVERIVIAYEPVWAIGTGLTATEDEAEAACAHIRETVRREYGSCADAMRIQYGGSMNAGNAAGLLAKANIDGGLIGGASLKASDFLTIIKAAAASEV